MALTLLGMQTEVYARGFTFLNDGAAGTTRVTRWVNDAMHQINDMADWPYLQTSTTGTAPLTIADLGTIECVTDVGHYNPLQPRDRRWLRTQFADLTTPGIPIYYYLTGSVINVYPTSTSTTLTVDYWKTATDLSAPTDVPLMPDRFRYAIVDYAVARGQRDVGNEQEAQAAFTAGNVLVAQMQAKLLSTQHQGAETFVPAVGEDT